MRIGNWRYRGILLHAVLILLAGMLFCKASAQTRLDSLKAKLAGASGVDQAQILTDIGREYFVKGDFNEALEYYVISLELNERLRNEKGLAENMKGIATVYAMMGGYDEALEYQAKALVILKSQKDTLGIGLLLTHMGNIYLQKEEFDKAKKYYQESLKLKEKSQSASTIFNLGICAFELGEYRSALGYCEEAMPISRKNKNIWEIAYGHIIFGNARFKLDQIGLAQAHLDSSLAISSREGMKDLIKAAYKLQYEIFEATRDFQKAFDYHVLYQNMKDSIFSQANGIRIAALQTKLETAEQDKEILVLRKEKQIQNIKMSKQRALVWLFASIGALVLGILVLAFFQFKTKSKLYDAEAARLHQQIEHNNWKLSSTALHLAEKNKLLEELTRQISNLNIGENQQIRTIKTDIKKAINLDSDWENFMTHFDNVHPGFFKKLNKEFPYLTANDEKLCAYIRMKLSTKEIAQIMNITPDSAKKAKVRLKKKLQLPADVSLINFINSL